MSTKACPFCAQTIHAQANVCKFCKANLAAPPPGPVHPPGPPPKDNTTKIVLLIVGLVVGLPCLALFGIGVFGYFLAKEGVERAEEYHDKAKTQASMTEITIALESFKVQHKRYPDKLMDLHRKPDWIKKEKWPTGGYLKNRRSLRDGWNNEYVYRVPGTNGEPFDLISYGSDGEPGGTDTAEDTWNHQNHP